MRFIIKVVALSVFPLLSLAQLKFGDNPETLDPSAIVEFESSKSGFLIPRLTTAQRDGLLAPVNGLIVYDTDEKGFFIRTDTEWRQIAWDKLGFYKADGKFSSNRKVDMNSNDLSFMGGKVAIGNTAPIETLSIDGVFSTDGFSSIYEPGVLYPVNTVVVYNGRLYAKTTPLASGDPFTDTVNWRGNVIKNSIYEVDGSLTSDRFVDLGANDLYFGGGDNDTTGKVSIGSTSPREILDVNGTVRVDGFSTLWDSKSNYDKNDLVFYNGVVYRSITGLGGSNPSSDTANWEYRVVPSIYSANGRLSSPRNIGMAANNLSFMPTTGLIGIGTTAPKEKLDISGGFKTHAFSSNWGGSSVSYSTGEIILYGARFYGNVKGASGTNPASDTANWNDRIFPEIDISNGSLRSDRVVGMGDNNFSLATTTGLVGIGTTAPRALLDARGGLRSNGFSSKFSFLQAYTKGELVLYQGIFYRSITGVSGMDPVNDSMNWEYNIVPNIYTESRSLLSSRTVYMEDKDLSFLSSNGGKLGIGTTSPRSLLDVSGVFRADGFSSKWSSTATYSVGEIVIYNKYVYRNRTGQTGTDPSNDTTNWNPKVFPDLYISNGSLTSQRTISMGANNLSFLYTTGNIGIGTTSPRVSLDVSGGVRATGFSTRWEPTATYGVGEIVLYDSLLYRKKPDTGTTDPAAPDPYSDTDNWESNVQPNLYWVDSSLTSSRLVNLGSYNLNFPTTTGLVGIGTTSPRSMLDVSGGFRTIGFSSKWASTATYSIGEIVIHNQFMYKNRTGQTGTDPSADTINWNPSVFLDLYTASGVLKSDRVVNIGSNNLYIARTTGSVGIGTTAVPRSVLDVAGPVRATGFSTKWSPSTTYQSRDLVLYNGGLYRSVTGQAGTLGPDLDTVNWNTNLSPSIYNTNGDLGATRRIYIGSNNLSFSTTTGDVGIGTTSPRSLLDIKGTFRTNTFSNKWVSTTTYTTGELVLYSSNFYRKRGTLVNTASGQNPSTDTTNWDPKVLLSFYEQNGTISTDRIVSIGNNNFVIQTTGNVGIGTTSPRSALDIVNGGIYTRGFSSKWKEIDIYDIDDIALYNGVIYRNKSGVSTAVGPDTDSDNWEYRVVPSVYTYSSSINSNRVVNLGNYDLSFETSSGRMGIGTTNPRVLLDVSGGIRADGFHTKWTQTTTYTAKDIVIYNGRLYRSKTGVTGTNPTTDTANWENEVFANLYNSSGALTGDRVVDMGNYNLYFNRNKGGVLIGSTSSSVRSATLDVRGEIRTDGFSSKWGPGETYATKDIVIYNNVFYRAKTGAILTAGLTPETDTVGWESGFVPTLYTEDGILASNRLIQMSTNSLFFMPTTGAVGIGNAMPNTMLNVSGGIRTEDFSTRWKQANTYKTGDLVIYNSNFYRNIKGQNAGSPNVDTANWYSQILKNVYTSSGTLTSSRDVNLGNNDLSFVSTTGKIGIGTTTPRSLVDVSGGFRTDGFSSSWNANATYSVGDLLLYDSGVYRSITGDAGTDPSADTINWDPNLTPNLYREDGEILSSRVVNMDKYNLYFSTTTGALGIGTTTPRSLLDVSGSLRAYGFSSSWSSAGTYSKGELVLYNSDFYRNIAGKNGPNNPDQDTANWNRRISTNLYENNGALNKNRSVLMGSNNIFITSTSKGRVAIGGTAPRTLFDVSGAVRADGFSTLWRPSSTYANSEFVIYNGNLYKHISDVNTATNPNTDTANWDLTWSNNIYSKDGALDSNRIVELRDKNLSFTSASGGRVGIGTTAPRNLLDVHGDIYSDYFSTQWYAYPTTYQQGAAVLYNGKMYFKKTTSLTSGAPSADSSNWAELDFSTLYQKDYTLSDNRIVNMDGKNLFFFGSEGEKIGIGTNAPTHTLHVNGILDAYGFQSKNYINPSKETFLADPYVLRVPLIADGTSLGWKTYNPRTGILSNQNMYDSNGVMTSHRVVNLKKNSLSFAATDGGTLAIGVTDAAPAFPTTAKDRLHVSGTVVAEGFSTSWAGTPTYSVGDIAVYNGGFYRNISGANDTTKNPVTDTTNWINASNESIYLTDGSLYSNRSDNKRVINLNSNLAFNLQDNNAHVGIGATSRGAALEIASVTGVELSGIFRSSRYPELMAPNNNSVRYLSNSGFSTKWVAKDSSPLPANGSAPTTTSSGDYTGGHIVVYDGAFYVNATSVNLGNTPPPSDKVNWSPYGVDLYVADGRIASNRNVNIGGNVLNFKASSGGILSIGSTKPYNAGQLSVSGGIFADGFSSSWSGTAQYPINHVLVYGGQFLWHKTTANTTLRPDKDTVNWSKMQGGLNPTIYTVNGSLTGPRRVELSDKVLAFTSIKSLTIGASSTAVPKYGLSINGEQTASNDLSRSIFIRPSPMFYAATQTNTSPFPPVAGDPLNYQSVILGGGSRLLSNTAYNNILIALGATASNLTTGVNNVFIGNNVASSTRSSTENVAIGTNAGSKLSSGSKNTLVGYNSGASLTTGNQNTFVGPSSGSSATIGSGNVVVGDDMGFIKTQNNYVVINPPERDLATGSLIITDAGYVGIGQTKPTSLLDIKSNDLVVANPSRTIAINGAPVLFDKGGDSKTLILGNANTSDSTGPQPGDVTVGISYPLSRYSSYNNVVFGMNAAYDMGSTGTYDGHNVIIGARALVGGRRPGHGGYYGLTLLGSLIGGTSRLAGATDVTIIGSDGGFFTSLTVGFLGVYDKNGNRIPNAGTILFNAGPGLGEQYLSSRRLLINRNNSGSPFSVSWLGAADASYMVDVPGNAQSTGQITPSDVRIKKSLSPSSTSEDLETLNKIKVTNYKLIDTLAEGDRTYKKVIAQQLKKIYPDAVTETTGYVPNIYSKPKRIKYRSNNEVVLVFNKKLDSSCATASSVKLLDTLSNTYLADVKSATGKRLVLSGVPKDKRVAFAYGIRVKDYMSVDYDAIAMLKISATQELHKRINELKTEKLAIKAEIDKLKQKALTPDERSRLKTLVSDMALSNKVTLSK